MCYNYGVNYILRFCTEVIVIKKINIKNKKSRQFFADGSFFIKEEIYYAHNVQNLQAKYISCKRCGSKVNKDYIHNNSCPVCHNNMLSDTVQKRLDAFNARIDGLKASIVAEKERRAAKAPTRYLIVYCEYVG